MRKYFDTLINTKTGLPVANATISVTSENGTPAQLYSDNGATAIANPINQVVTDINGLFQFFVASGTYTLGISSGSTMLTIANVEIFDDAADGPLSLITTSQSYNVAVSDLGKTIRANATSGAHFITLPATATDGSLITVIKSDASANRVTVRTSSNSELAWLSIQNDSVTFVSASNGWTPLRWNIAPVVDAFTSSGTWTKPPLAARISSILVGGGGGGGGGRRGASSSNRSGGGGGAGGYVSGIINMPPSRYDATSTIVVGAGGAGGAGGAANDSDGAAGSPGGQSSMACSTSSGRTIIALGGDGGAGGANAAAAGGQAQPLWVTYPSGSGASASLSATALVGISSSGPAGGGAGGSLDSGNNVRLPSAGGTGTRHGSVAAGGTAGASGSTNGGNGTAIGSTVEQLGGGGGGGGYAALAATGGAGGAGGQLGGGGGGGAAATNGQIAGAGGAGAAGQVIVTTYFA